MPYLTPVPQDHDVHGLEKTQWFTTNQHLEAVVHYLGHHREQTLVNMKGMRDVLLAQLLRNSNGQSKGH